MPDEPYQSLYRRYRPARFSEVLGQDHVTVSLRNAVRSDRIGHAYLFSGPRGTGKTSTARILAKALDCTDPKDGEPCCVCQSCLAVAAGNSLDVHELDAASNNGVEAMRDLVSRAALATPGRWKVYIVDEVHMLSTAASNALLKTLEEPPSHVVFVLATTDPQKVLPTIRSRAQHFEFRLLSPGILGELVDKVGTQAGIEVTPGTLHALVKRARGSARDALSALDQVAAGGDELSISESDAALDELVDAVVTRDPSRTLTAVARAIDGGEDPRVLAGELIELLRQSFLATVAPALSGLGEADVARAIAQVEEFGLAGLVRSMEVIGRAQVEMRDALDPRITLEVALVRLTSAELDLGPEALAERVARLERMGTAAHPGTAARPPSSLANPAQPTGAIVDDRPDAKDAAARLPQREKTRDLVGAPSPLASPDSSGSSAGKPQSASELLRDRYGTTGGSRPSTAVEDDQGPTRALSPSGAGPSRDDLTQAWGDKVLGSLTTRARSRFKAGRFVDSDGEEVSFALPDPVHKEMCEELRPEVEGALRDHFGWPLRLRLVVEGSQERAAKGQVVSRAGATIPTALGHEAKHLSPVSGSPPGTSGPGGSAQPELDPQELRDQRQVEEEAAQLLFEAFPGIKDVSDPGQGSR